MKVLADLHHFDLYHSFQLLFEERLGWELYRPIGYDWPIEDFWTLCDRRYTAVSQGYLSTTSGACRAGLGPFWASRGAAWARQATELVKIGNIEDCGNGIYSIEDLSKGITQRGITLERFKQEEFDVLISSVPQHFEPTERLRQLHQPQARHIHHMGSTTGREIPEGAKNVMIHAAPKEIPTGTKCIIYSQEFDTEVFHFSNPTGNKAVRSYVHFDESEELWKSTGLDWDFAFVGKTLASLDETIVGTHLLADCIRGSDFTWHIKPGGEGYGHILHNSFASGRPVVINGADYVGSRGEELLEDMVTSIDITGRSPNELRNKLVHASKKPVHQKMCCKAYSRFREVVDFDKEFEEIKTFLEELE